ncbi:ferredoxin (plasmid) [Mesorhizobium sp. 131-2-5]|nr:ferredoxin [Mesorhizobium sp. 131-2-5]
MKVVTTSLIANGVREIVLAPVNEELPDWTAGAHINVHLPSGNRQYSLTGDPAVKNEYRVGVKLEAGGRGGSRAMHQIGNGSVLEISAPLNNFSLVPSSDPHLLLAGGIGVTPLLSMAYELARAGTDWRMIVCSHSPEVTPFVDELSCFAPGRVHIVYSYGEAARRLEFDDLFASLDARTKVYLCGSGPFNQSASQAFRASGHRPGNLIFESFSKSQQSVAPAENGFYVELALSGRTVWVPNDKSILDMVEASGLTVESACREGYCGTCVVDVVTGKPIHRDDNLFTDEEKESGKVMTLCRCRSEGDLKIML